MKKNKVAFIILGFLIPLAAWLIIHQRNSTIKKELKDFAVKDTAAITKIILKDKANKEIILEREGKNWRLNQQHYARLDAINLLLKTIKTIQVRNPVGKRAVENVVKQLATGSTSIQIFAGEELVKQYYIGNETQDMEGTYMLLKDVKTGLNSSVPFVVSIPGFNGYVSGRYFTDAKLWRSKSVYNYSFDGIKSIQLEYNGAADSGFTVSVNGANQFEISKNNGSKIQPIDTLFTKMFVSYFFNLNFEEIVTTTPQKIDSILSVPWRHLITVTDIQGVKKTLRTFPKAPQTKEMTDDAGNPLKEDPDRMIAFINDNKNEAYFIQFFTFGKIFKFPSQFKYKRNNN